MSGGQAAVESSDSGGFSISTAPKHHWVQVVIPSNMVMDSELPAAAWHFATRTVKDCSRKIRNPDLRQDPHRRVAENGRTALKKAGYCEFIAPVGNSPHGHLRFRNPEGVKGVWFDAWDHTALRAGTTPQLLYFQLQWDARQKRRWGRRNTTLARLMDRDPTTIAAAWRTLRELGLVTQDRKLVVPPPMVHPVLPSSGGPPSDVLFSTEELHAAGCACALHDKWEPSVPAARRSLIKKCFDRIGKAVLSCTCVFATPAEAAPLPPPTCSEEAPVARGDSIAAALRVAQRPPLPTPSKSTLLHGTLEAYDRWVAEGAPSLADKTAAEAAVVLAGLLTRYMAKNGAATKPSENNLINWTAALEELAAREVQEPDAWIVGFGKRKQIHVFDMVPHGMQCFFSTVKGDMPLVHSIFMAFRTRAGISGLEQFFLDNQAFKSGKWNIGDMNMPHHAAWKRVEEQRQQEAAEAARLKREQEEAKAREAAAKPSKEQLHREAQRRAWIDYLHFKNMIAFHPKVVDWRNKYGRHISYEDECADDPKKFFTRAGLPHLYDANIESRFTATTKEIDAFYVAQRTRFVGRPIQVPQLPQRTWDPVTIPATHDCPTDLGIRLVGLSDGELPEWDRDAVLADLDARTSGRDPRRALYRL